MNSQENDEAAQALDDAGFYNGSVIGFIVADTPEKKRKVARDLNTLPMYPVTHKQSIALYRKLMDAQFARLIRKYGLSTNEIKVARMFFYLGGAKSRTITHNVNRLYENLYDVGAP